VLAAAEEQDRFRVRVSKIDLARGAWYRDPSIDPEIRVCLEPRPSVGVTPLWSVCAGLRASLGDAAVDDHLYRRIFSEHLVQ
jgi:hypothetical protein